MRVVLAGIEREWVLAYITSVPEMMRTSPCHCVWLDLSACNFHLPYPRSARRGERHRHPAALHLQQVLFLGPWWVYLGVEVVRSGGRG